MAITYTCHMHTGREKRVETTCQRSQGLGGTSCRSPKKIQRFKVCLSSLSFFLRTVSDSYKTHCTLATRPSRANHLLGAMTLMFSSMAGVSVALLAVADALEPSQKVNIGASIHIAKKIYIQVVCKPAVNCAHALFIYRVVAHVCLHQPIHSDTLAAFACHLTDLIAHSTTGDLACITLLHDVCVGAEPGSRICSTSVGLESGGQCRRSSWSGPALFTSRECRHRESV